MNPELDFEKRFRLVREVIETIVLTLLMFLVIRFAVQNFNVDGTSMEPRLHNGELILVDKWTYLFHPPERGDVIVFVAPPEPTLDFVKRIIGVPGDRITIHGTVVTVDGVTLKETYVDPINQGNPTGADFTNMLVPPNKYFVMGDDRVRSDDSRRWGFVPRGNIIGRAALVYWPLGQDNNGFLPNYSSVFANVHQPGAPANALNNGNLNVSADAILMVLAPLSLSLFVRLISKRRRAVGSPESHL
ncbi:MAG TPA: signal peptidase I [Ktedonobacteraceae bacterium]|nr:signal peptidase I [Ktedonobacteraceae bacterium]